MPQCCCLLADTFSGAGRWRKCHGLLWGALHGRPLWAQPGVSCWGPPRPHRQSPLRCWQVCADSGHGSHVPVPCLSRACAHSEVSRGCDLLGDSRMHSFPWKPVEAWRQGGSFCAFCRVVGPVQQGLGAPGHMEAMVRRGCCCQALTSLRFCTTEMWGPVRSGRWGILRDSARSRPSTGSSALETVGEVEAGAGVKGAISRGVGLRSGRGGRPSCSHGGVLDKAGLTCKWNSEIPGALFISLNNN